MSTCSKCSGKGAKACVNSMCRSCCLYHQTQHRTQCVQHKRLVKSSVNRDRSTDEDDEPPAGQPSQSSVSDASSSSSNQNRNPNSPSITASLSSLNQNINPNPAVATITTETLTSTLTSVLTTVLAQQSAQQFKQLEALLSHRDQPPTAISVSSSSTSSATNIRPHLKRFEIDVDAPSPSKLSKLAKDTSQEVTSKDNIPSLPQHRVSTGLFSTLTDGLVPIMAGMAIPTVQLFTSALGSVSKQHKPYKTVDEFKEALNSWATSQFHSPLATPERNSAMMSYITETLSFAHEAGLDAAFKYHSECVKSSQLAVPLYNPMTDGGIYLKAYIQHIRPVIDATLSQAASKRRKVNAKANSDSSSSSSSSAARCSIHGVGHSDSECNKQKNKSKRVVVKKE